METSVTKILIHSKPNKRGSWAFCGQSGWYVGLATKHYRCVTYYLQKTYKEVVSDTVKFIPRHIHIPEASIDNHIKHSLYDLTLSLQNKTSTFPQMLFALPIDKLSSL